MEANEGLDEEPAPHIEFAEDTIDDILEQYNEPEDTDLEDTDLEEIDFGGKADVLEEEITSYSKPKKSKGKAYEIDLDDFGETGYSTVMVYLYREDATLTESDQETVIQNWREIGPDTIQKLLLDDEHDRAYTRNETTGVDYEIVALDEKFSDEGGVDD